MTLGSRPPRKGPRKGAGKAKTGAGAKTGGGKSSGGVPTRARDLTVQVRTARGRKPSSTQWLQRQLNDPYVQEARRLGLRSRAAFKLMELDDRFGLIRPGLRIVDLGAAPGGWTQIAVTRSRSQQETTGGRVVGLDILDWESVPGATCLVCDFMDDAAPALLREALGGPADLVLSDMAAPTTGHRKTDHLRVMGLAEAAWEFAEEVLAPGGAFCCKVFQGGTEGALLTRMKQTCATVRHAKPPASRADSAEVYVVAQGFRGRKDDSNAEAEA